MDFELHSFFRVRFGVEVALENNVAFAILFPALEQMNVFPVKAFQFKPISQPSFRGMRPVNDVYGLVQGFIPLLFERQEVGIRRVLVSDLNRPLNVHFLGFAGLIRK